MASSNPAGPIPAGPPPDDARLDEVRHRLAGLDDLELARHPEEFTAIDGLLRAALDGTDRAGRS